MNIECESFRKDANNLSALYRAQVNLDELGFRSEIIGR